MDKLADLKKLNTEKLQEKVTELKKELFERRQKLYKGEEKDFSAFNKIRKNIARAKTLLNQTEKKEEESK